jgi:hypothetical protein
MDSIAFNKLVQAAIGLRVDVDELVEDHIDRVSGNVAFIGGLSYLGQSFRILDGQFVTVRGVDVEVVQFLYNERVDDIYLVRYINDLDRVPFRDMTLRAGTRVLMNKGTWRDCVLTEVDVMETTPKFITVLSGDQEMKISLNQMRFRTIVDKAVQDIIKTFEATLENYHQQYDLVLEICADIDNSRPGVLEKIRKLQDVSMLTKFVEVHCSHDPFFMEKYRRIDVGQKGGLKWKLPLVALAASARGESLVTGRHLTTFIAAHENPLFSHVAEATATNIQQIERGVDYFIKKMDIKDASTIKQHFQTGKTAWNMHKNARGICVSNAMTFFASPSAIKNYLTTAFKWYRSEGFFEYYKKSGKYGMHLHLYYKMVRFTSNDLVDVIGDIIGKISKTTPETARSEYLVTTASWYTETSGHTFNVIASIDDNSKLCFYDANYADGDPRQGLYCTKGFKPLDDAFNGENYQNQILQEYLDYYKRPREFDTVKDMMDAYSRSYKVTGPIFEILYPSAMNTVSIINEETLVSDMIENSRVAVEEILARTHASMSYQLGPQPPLPVYPKFEPPKVEPPKVEPPKVEPPKVEPSKFTWLSYLGYGGKKRTLCKRRTRRRKVNTRLTKTAAFQSKS